MKLIYIRILISILAGIVVIVFSIATYKYPIHSTILLTIEIILLPLIYIIGNYLAEESMKNKFDEDKTRLEELMESLNQKWLNEKERRKMVEFKIKELRKNGK